MRTRHDQGMAGYTTDDEIRTHRYRREEEDTDDPMYYVRLIVGMALLVTAFVIIPAAIVAMALDPANAWMF